MQWYERPQFIDPVLVMMLAGWYDTSGAAAAAMVSLETSTSARTIARFDRDTFIDYRARRPTMELRDGVNSRIVWPDISIRAGVDQEGRDVLMLTGYEPDAAWERFCIEVLDVAKELGVKQVIGLGAYPFASPHTRPVRLSTTTPDEHLAETLPYLRNSVDVSAGICAVLEHTFHSERIPTVSLWAQVPHYVSAMSFPAASMALLEGIVQVSGLSVDMTELRSESIVQRQRLDDLVESNTEHAAMVAQLERHYDSLVNSAVESTHPSLTDSGPMNVDELPSAEELAEELEQFLRDQGPT